MSDLDREPTSTAASPSRSPLGTLGLAMVRVQARVQTITLVVTTVVAIIVAATVVPALAVPLGDIVDYPVALLILGILWASSGRHARRALPHGDWRAPLLEAQPAIPGSDVRVLVADFGLPMFEILVRKAVVPFTVLLALVGLSLAVLPALLR